MPVASSHVRAVIVVVAATTAPSGDTASAFTLSSHSKRARGAPVAASHTRTSPLLAPVTIRVPSGTKATSVSVLPCPASTTASRPVAASQTRAVSSTAAETTSVPSGENATEVTMSRARRTT